LSRADFQNIRLVIIIPTFKEPYHIRQVTEALLSQSFSGYTAIIINSNPGDATSSYLHSIGDDRFIEISGNPEVYWTKAMHIGIIWAGDHLDQIDYYLFMNCDVSFNHSFLEHYLSAAIRHPRAILCAVARSGSRYISSGVRMKSWVLSLTGHRYMGIRSNKPACFTPVDMLAGRTMLFPAGVVDTVGTPNFRALPHYGADYEFSARARRHGFRLYVYGGVETEIDTKNTGRKSFFKDTGFCQRIGFLFDIKSPMNLKYRYQFTRLTYPKLAQIPGIATVFLKTMIEALFGRAAHRLLRRRRISG
jgi:GT2 family glycosyltransferase